MHDIVVKLVCLVPNLPKFSRACIEKHGMAKVQATKKCLGLQMDCNTLFLEFYIKFYVDKLQKMYVMPNSLFILAYYLLSCTRASLLYRVLTPCLFIQLSTIELSSTFSITECDNYIVQWSCDCYIT